jgi:hypothetical protein
VTPNARRPGEEARTPQHQHITTAERTAPRSGTATPPPDVRVGPARVVVSADLRHPFVGTATLADGVVTLTGVYRGASGARPGTWSWPASRLEVVRWEPGR